MMDYRIRTLMNQPHKASCKASCLEISHTKLHSFSVNCKGRSYDDEIITMVTTGTEAPSAPSSSVTEFTLSETVATHHVSEENINGGNSYTRTVKQKIVLKVSMPSEKSRSKAMALVAALAGVNSIGVAGDDKDQLVVVGDSVDAVCLARCLRRKIDGHAVILHIGVAGDGKDKKPHERKDGDLFEKPDLQLPEHQPEGPPAMVPVRRTFNMSKVHRRRVRLPVVRKPRMMTPRTQHLSSQRSTARRVLPLFVWCALCFVMLLASVFGH